MATQAPKSNPELMEYHIYPMVPDFLAEHSIDKFLGDQQDAFLAYLSQYLLGYIWQKDPLRLKTVAPDHEADTGFPEIYGQTDYGDNVEDEWFIVFLLRQLTMAHPGLVVRVSDNDGEFLLIEAAEDIPKWLQPDTAENRVFFYDGDVHILPKEVFPLNLTPNIEDATNYIRENPHRTKAPPEVQCHIHRRIAAYPSKARENVHRTHCYIPAKLAAILDHSPTLVAPLVHAFYLRDPIDLKACVTMQHFQPGTRVMREVKMTRCLYAQLMSQRFKPDARSGFTLPKHSSPKFKAYDLGMKLSHGAEILWSRIPSNASYEQQHSRNLTKRWQYFIKDLTNKGYFKDEIEGSVLYKKLYAEAQKFYYSQVEDDTTEPGLQMMQVLRETTFDLEVMRRQEKELQPPDDDSWLTISQADLDKMLEEASGKGSSRFNFSSVAQSMRAFISKISSHEGAEMPKPDEDSEVHLDPNSFIQTMQKMFEFEDDEDDHSSDDLNEYSSDEEVEVHRRQSKSAPSANKQTLGDVGDYLGLQDYMSAMDSELSGATDLSRGEAYSSSTTTTTTERSQNGTTVRTSTTTTTQSSTNSAPVAPPRSKTKKAAPKATLDDFDDIDDLDDDFEPVAVDLNMVDNLLQSYNAQQGMPGPTSNMLGSMGIRMHSSKKS